MMPPDSPILIAGASVRAAVCSAKMAGWNVCGADLFCDRDLQSQSECFRLNPYPDALSALVASGRFSGLMITGGLENEPDLLAHCQRQVPLLGVDLSFLRAVRDPFQLARIWQANGIPSPEVREVRPTNGQWLQKPLRSAGGQRILRSTPNDETTPSNAYFQRMVDGTSCSGVFAVQPSQAYFLGATEQLVGTDWSGPEPFSYCGSVGPMPQTQSSVQQWQQIGHALASQVLQVNHIGIVGVDAIEQNGEIWPVEVNPRYVASIEILERSWGESIFQRGLRFDHKICDSTKDAQRIFGKLIVYANRDGILAEDFFRTVQDTNRGKSVAFADIPNAAAVIRHSPILTVFAEGNSRATVLAGLRIRQQLVYSSIC